MTISMIPAQTDFEERPHPGDPSAAETQTHRRRFALGLLIAVSLNIAFLSGGAAIADYVTKLFHPFFFKKDKVVFVTLDVSPSPSPSPSAAVPSPR